MSGDYTTLTASLVGLLHVSAKQRLHSRGDRRVVVKQPSKPDSNQHHHGNIPSKNIITAAKRPAATMQTAIKMFSRRRRTPHGRSLGGSLAQSHFLSSRLRVTITPRTNSTPIP